MSTVLNYLRKGYEFFEEEKNSEENTKKAIQEYKKALEIDKESTAAWCLMGDAYLKLGKYDDAINCFQKFVEKCVIIAHNCGYVGYEKDIYSKEATKEACEECDYLEIDLELGRRVRENMAAYYLKKGKNWHYYHVGREGKDKRKFGVSLDDFLTEFNNAAKWVKSKSKPGLFLDLKEHLNCEKVDKLMNYLNRKYKNNEIPEGTPLMIFTGFHPLNAFYSDTTCYFLKWLAAADNQKSQILDSKHCPKLTIVTRGVDIEELVYSEKKAVLNKEEKKWFEDNFNKKVWWGFNPNLAWYYNHIHMKTIVIAYQVFEKSTILIPWLFKWQEEEEGWIRVIFTILKNYMNYLRDYCSNKNNEIPPKSPSWGIITYKPNELKECLNKRSFLQQISCKLSE